MLIENHIKNRWSSQEILAGRDQESEAVVLYQVAETWDHLDQGWLASKSIRGKCTVKAIILSLIFVDIKLCILKSWTSF